MMRNESNLSWVKIPENIYWEELFYSDYTYGSLIIMFPDELKDNHLLKENIPKILNVIKDYINKSQEYKRYMDCALSVHFDSEKESFTNKAYESQEEADKVFYQNGLLAKYIDVPEIKVDEEILNS